MPNGGKACDPSRLPGYGTGGLGSNIDIEVFTRSYLL